jgi:predicted transposase/invertase (TIGR01784 family)
MFGVTVSYIYVNFFAAEADDEILMAGENRVGLILYAAKCAYISGKDEGKKFRYLREISDLWAAKGWNPHDKRIILEAVNYLFNLTDPMYSSQIVEYIENLSMTKEDSEMYVSVFERVYTEKGRLEGIEEGRLEGIEEGRLEGIEEGRLEGIQEGKQEIIRKMLAYKMPFDTISKITGFSRDDIDGMEQRND